jgi:hypothetical protein
MVRSAERFNYLNLPENSAGSCRRAAPVIYRYLRILVDLVLAISSRAA